MEPGAVERSGSGLAFRREGSGPPVVLLHGIPGCAASWDGVVARLANHAAVIVPDLLGFGGSDRPRGFERLRAEAQAAAVGALIAELGLGAVTVVGHDFGGPVALSLAARRPDAVAAVGLLATNAFTDTPIPFPLSTLTWPIAGPIARRALFSGPSLRMMLRQGVGPRVRPPDAGAYLGDRAQQRAIGTIFAASLTRLAEVYRPIEDALSSLGVPVLVGWGDRDPFFPPAQGERTARAAGATLRAYEGAGHFLPHERPDEVSADVAALVSAVHR